MPLITLFETYSNSLIKQIKIIYHLTNNSGLTGLAKNWHQPIILVPNWIGMSLEEP